MGQSVDWSSLDLRVILAGLDCGDCEGSADLDLILGMTLLVITNYLKYTQLDRFKSLK